MAKLSRESRLRERRQEKAARKEARKHAAALEAESPAVAASEVEPLDGEPVLDSTEAPAVPTASQ
jgi:hypothetical protein